MYCTNCGNQLPPNANACPNCATPVPYFPPELVPNYLWQSILVTLCCCPPFGIVAIVYATQVNGKLAVFDLEGAQESSRKARTWALIAFVTGMIISAGFAVLSLMENR